MVSHSQFSLPKGTGLQEKLWIHAQKWWSRSKQLHYTVLHQRWTPHSVDSTCPFLLIPLPMFVSSTALLPSLALWRAMTSKLRQFRKRRKQTEALLKMLCAFTLPRQKVKVPPLFFFNFINTSIFFLLLQAENRERRKTALPPAFLGIWEQILREHCLTLNSVNRV